MQSTAEFFQDIMQEVWDGNLQWQSWEDANKAAKALGGRIIKQWEENSLTQTKWLFIDNSTIVVEAFSRESNVGSCVKDVGIYGGRSDLRAQRKILRNTKIGEERKFPFLSIKQLTNMASTELPAGSYSCRVINDVPTLIR